MRAVVLVGGFGTRLRPLTLSVPKPMLPVVDRPIVEWVVGGLAAAGIDEVVLALGFRPDVFQEAYPDDTCAGVRLRYAVESEPLDTAGAIRFAALDAGIEERFVVVNGDVLTDLDVRALLDFHAGHGAEGTIALHKVEDPSAFGVVPTDETGKVLAFVEKPPRDEAPTDLINAGTYVLEPSVLDRIPDGRRVSIERETFPAMVADGVLYATDDKGVYWADTGTPQQYLQVMLDLVAGKRAVPAPPAVATGAVVAEGAELVDAVVMVGAEVAGSVERSAILPGARVEGGARVVDSVIGHGAVVGAGASVTDSVLGRDVVVAPGAVVSGQRIPEPE
jgi:mannose-1-phosphate guanylyltransferase